MIPRLAIALVLGTTLVRGAAAQEQDTPFLVAPASEGVVLRWAWPEGERPLGYQVERREAGGAWTRITPQPIARVRARAQARALLGDLYDRYEPLLFPANPLDELRDPESYRSMLLLLADIEPGVAQALGLRYDDRDARTGTTYQYRLIAVTRRGENEVGASTPVVAGAYRSTAPPDSAQARQQVDGIALRWSTAGSFSAYHVFRRRGAIGAWERLSPVPVIVFSDENGAGTEASAEFYRDTTARAGDTLAYAVAGIDPFGRLSERSHPAPIVVRDVIPPAPPHQVTTAARADTIVISWVPGPDAETVGYQVWRGTSRDGAFEPVGNATPATQHTQIDTGLPAGRVWWYYVTARDAAGNESTPSFMAVAEIPDVTPPGAPDSVRGRGQTGRLELAWARVTAADLRGYRVYRASLESGEFGLLTETPIGETQFADSIRIAADHSFYYRVTAVDSAFNESAPSTVLAVRPPDVTPPSAPQIASVAPGEGILVVSWSPNPEADVTWYRVRHRVRGRQAWSEPSDSVPASAVSDTITNLPPGELLEVSLIAIDDAGNRSEPARPVVGRPVKQRPPQTLEIRRASVDRDTRAVTLEWESPAADVVRISVRRRRAPDTTWVEIGSTTPAARRFRDVTPGAEAGRVEYTLTALDQFGNAATSRPRRVNLPEEGQ